MRILSLGFAFASAIALAPVAPAASDTPPPPPATNAPAGITAAVQGEWIIDLDPTVASIKKSPKWRAEDEAMLPGICKMFSAYEMNIGADSVTCAMGRHSDTKKVTVKSQSGPTTVLAVQAPAKAGAAPREVTITITVTEKGQLNIRNSACNDMDDVLWKRKPAGWKPVSEEEAMAGMMAHAVASSTAKPGTAAPTVPKAPKADKPPFEKDPWSRDLVAFTINDTMDQAGFDAFCAAHPDTEGLNVDRAQKITSIAPLAKLAKLKTLTLRGVTKMNTDQAIDLAPLAGLTGLTKLDCYATHVVNTGALKGLKQLREISFYMSSVDSIACVAELPALETLDLYGFAHKFPNYEPLAASKIKKLNLYMNKQATDENLKVLGKIQTLEEFAADLTPTFHTIEFLRNQPNLQVVRLWNDPISDISPLAGKTKLVEVSLWGTKVTDLSPLAGAADLRQINLQDTAVTDISPLLGLKKLWSVELPATVPAEQVAKLKAANPSARVTVQPPKKK